MEGELSDIRQMMLDLDLDPIDDNDADYWYSEVYEK